MNRPLLHLNGHNPDAGEYVNTYEWILSSVDHLVFLIDLWRETIIII